MTVMVIDAGSSSVRALLFDDDANAVPGAMARREHRFNSDNHGMAVADADHLRGLVEACIDEVLSHPAAQRINAVAMTTFAGNWLGVDADGQPQTPLYTYADTRSRDHLPHLRELIDTSAMIQYTGTPLHTAYFPAQFSWAAAQGTRITHMMDFATYCYRRWFGRPVPQGYSVASWSGIFDRVSLVWSAQFQQILPLDGVILPELADYDAIQTGLSDDYAKRWAHLRDVPFTLAVGDGAAANIGSGGVDDAHAALTIGTTAAIRRVTQGAAPTVPEGLWSYRVSADRHLTGGATTEGGNIFAWAAQTLNLPDDIETQLMQRPPVSHRVGFLPLLAGERSPGYHAAATGIIAGLRLSTTPLDILQAALEGVALRLALIAERLFDHDTVNIMAGGGALAQSPAWAQIIADALERPLHLVDVGEATARGAAILALVALHQREIESFMPPIAASIDPRPQHFAPLREARHLQQHLYHTLTSLSSSG